MSNINSPERQAAMLTSLMLAVRNEYPTASTIEVGTGDQNNGYGFWATDILDASERSLTPDGLPDEFTQKISPFLYDLNWNSVNTDKSGYGAIAIDLPDDPTYRVSFTAAQRFELTLTADEIREIFMMEPTELVAAVGHDENEAVKARLAEQRAHIRAKRGRLHELTNVTLAD
jgi:hypothetical protein